MLICLPSWGEKRWKGTFNKQSQNSTMSSYTYRTKVNKWLKGLIKNDVLVQFKILPAAHGMVDTGAKSDCTVMTSVTSRIKTLVLHDRLGIGYFQTHEGKWSFLVLGCTHRRIWYIWAGIRKTADQQLLTIAGLPSGVREADFSGTWSSKKWWSLP